MIDKNTARKTVEDYINSSYHVEGDSLVILDEETLQKDYGWIFFYTSHRYLETNLISHMLAGNGPIVVEKESGALTQLSTAMPLQESIRDYEIRRK
jgi:hypothetical protein